MYLLIPAPPTTMESMALFSKLLEQSPIIALILYLLATVWKYVQKKDEEMAAVRAAENARNLDMMERFIKSNADSSSVNLQLANSLNKLSDAIDDNQAMVMRELNDLKNALAKSLNTRPETNGRSPQSKTPRPADATRP